jgi:arsenite methyltransferase
MEHAENRKRNKIALWRQPVEKKLDQSDQVKEAVRRYYGNVASQQLEGGSCCSGATSCCPPEVESSISGDRLQIPVEAVVSSRGCGSPVGLASMQPGEVVLDLGCGGGLDVFLASQRVGPTGYVYGLDMTDEMLELARQNAARAGVENVEFLKGDLEDIPLPEKSVDVIISNCVVNLTPDKKQALHEAWRVLRPGGRLAISDIVIDGTLEGLGMSEEQVRSMLSWVGCIAGALTRDQFRAYLLEAGFSDVAVEVLHRYTLDDFSMLQGGEFQGLDPAEIQELVSRFTSSAILARRPSA